MFRPVLAAQTSMKVVCKLLRHVLRRRVQAVAVDGLGNVVFSDEPTNRILRAERLMSTRFKSPEFHQVTSGFLIWNREQLDGTCSKLFLDLGLRLVALQTWSVGSK